LRQAWRMNRGSILPGFPSPVERFRQGAQRTDRQSFEGGSPRGSTTREEITRPGARASRPFGRPRTAGPRRIVSRMPHWPTRSPSRACSARTGPPASSLPRGAAGTLDTNTSHAGAWRSQARSAPPQGPPNLPAAWPFSPAGACTARRHLSRVSAVAGLPDTGERRTVAVACLRRAPCGCRGNPPRRPRGRGPRTEVTGRPRRCSPTWKRWSLDCVQARDLIRQDQPGSPRPEE
jgi:hypothetical protein